MNKKNIVVWIVVIVMSGLLIWFGIYAMNATKEDEKNNTKQNNTEQKQETKKTNKTVDKLTKDVTISNKKINIDKSIDDNAITDVLNQLNLIMGFYSKKESFDLNNNMVYFSHAQLQYYGIFYELINKTNELTFVHKLKLALHETPTSDLSVPINEVYIPDSHSDHASEILLSKRFKEIKVSDLKNKYKELFDDELTTYDDDIGYGTKLYFYDKKRNVYIEYSPSIGGSDPVMLMYYINSINMHNDDIYVNMNFATVEFNMTYQYCYINDGVLYREISNNPVYTGKYVYDYNDKSKNIDECDKYLADKSNYNQLTNYRLIFKKHANGKYYFSNIEKVN